MHIAVLGGGFSGLAVCWNLIKNKNCSVDLYDPENIGGEASKIAAGLLHKYAGAHAKLNRFASESEQATLNLLRISEENLQSSVVISKGVLRIPLTSQQRQDYLKSASLYSDCKWLQSEDTLALTNGIVAHESLFVENGMTIDCLKYLQGLWLACEKAGAKFLKQKIENLNELSHYDAVVIATGANLHQFEELCHLKLKAIKGHLLEFAWPEIPPLKISLNSEAYITMMSGNKCCVAGSTYEKNFKDAFPDMKLAMELLLPKITALYPPLKHAKIVGCRAGIRAATPDHLPLIGQYGEKLYVISGMGSKGLLYHGLYAEKLSQLILSSILK